MRINIKFIITTFKIESNSIWKIEISIIRNLFNIVFKIFEILLIVKKKFFHYYYMINEIAIFFLIIKSFLMKISL